MIAVWISCWSWRVQLHIAFIVIAFRTGANGENWNAYKYALWFRKMCGIAYSSLLMFVYQHLLHVEGKPTLKLNLSSSVVLRWLNSGIVGQQIPFLSFNCFLQNYDWIVILYSLVQVYLPRAFPSNFSQSNWISLANEIVIILSTIFSQSHGGYKRVESPACNV